jgi:hypothetical protein
MAMEFKRLKLPLAIPTIGSAAWTSSCSHKLDNKPRPAIRRWFVEVHLAILNRNSNLVRTAK